MSVDHDTYAQDERDEDDREIRALNQGRLTSHAAQPAPFLVKPLPDSGIERLRALLWNQDIRTGRIG